MRHIHRPANLAVFFVLLVGALFALAIDADPGPPSAFHVIGHSLNAVAD